MTFDLMQLILCVVAGVIGYFAKGDSSSPLLTILRELLKPEQTDKDGPVLELLRQLLAQKSGKSPGSS